MSDEPAPRDVPVTPPDPPVMSDPPTPEELEAKRAYDLQIIFDLQAQAVAAAGTPQARKIDGFSR